MFLFLKLAWRNGLRNRRRTFLAGLAIGIGLGALIFADALLKGMSAAMIQSATDTFLGQAQIHRRGFLDTLEVEKTVAQGETVLADLKQEPEVKAFAPRTLAMAMITSPANAVSVILYGIEPDLEARVSKIKQAVFTGNYLKTEEPNQILIGDKLAQTLEVGVGNLVVVTVAQAGTGELSQAMFRVAGIYRFNERMMDGGMAFIPLAKSQELLDLGRRFHEIALDFNQLELSEDPTLGFWKKYSSFGNQAQSWGQIIPQLDAALQMTNFSLLIMSIILFSVVALGIMNTLFMSLYERMFEFGVLRAVGTRPGRMALMILFEAGSLAVISIGIGIVLGLLATWFFTWHGLDYSGIEYAGVTFLKPIYPVIHLYQYYVYPAVLFLFTLLVALYPAIYAARLNPIQAMRKSL